MHSNGQDLLYKLVSSLIEVYKQRLNGHFSWFIHLINTINHFANHCARGKKMKKKTTLFFKEVFII